MYGSGLGRQSKSSTAIERITIAFEFCTRDKKAVAPDTARMAIHRGIPQVLVGRSHRLGQSQTSLNEEMNDLRVRPLDEAATQARVT